MGSMNSFYGGPAGQSFYLSHIFNNRAELEADLMLGWQSDIHVGEFVLVNYGRYDQPDYANNLAKDNNISWNSTLWQKVYDESPMTSNDIQNPNGLAYKWIANMAGSSPVLTMKAPDRNSLPINSDILILDPDEKPRAWIDNSNTDNPILYMALPRGQHIDQVEINLIPYTDPPRAQINTAIDQNGDPYEILRLWLPESQALKIVESFIDRDDPLMPDIENDFDATIGATYIKSQMPSGYVYKQDEVFSLTYDNFTYWYYCVDPSNDKWARAQVTGNIKNILDEIEKATSKVWSIDILTSDWQPDGNKYSYTVTLNGLMCGKDGNIPPIIVHTSNLDEYSEIESAQATPGGTIKFTIPNIPQNTIGLVIIDNR